MLKLLHMALAALTFASFFVRGILALRGARWRERRMWRIAPHVIDTLLLVTGLLLAFRIRQYPLVDAWLTAKIAALSVYIALGFVALGRDRSRRARLAAWLAALLVFGYIVAVALTRRPWP